LVVTNLGERETTLFICPWSIKILQYYEEKIKNLSAHLGLKKPLSLLNPSKTYTLCSKNKRIPSKLSTANKPKYTHND
jgi:hypothetical protein